LARRYGWDEAILNNLEDFERLELDEPTRAALRLAERVTRDAHSVDDALFAELQRHFQEGEIVELVAVIGLFNYFNRFNNALQMEPTRPGER